MCWGSNEHGKSSPPGERFKAISSGTSHTCALRLDGTPVCWGRGRQWTGHRRRQVSTFRRDQHRRRPHLRNARGRYGRLLGHWGIQRCARPFRAAIGHCSIRSEVTTPCPCRHHQPNSSPPSARETPFAPFAQTGQPSAGPMASMGWSRLRTRSSRPSLHRPVHACALRSDGTVVCWGQDRFGQASPPSGVRLTGQMPRVPTGLVSISSGGHHTCALDADGKAACWGPPWWFGRFTGQFTSITSGSRHTCGVRLDGSVVCSGDNGYGQASPPQGERFTALASGFDYTCGLRASGAVSCWGRDDSGQSSPPAGETFVSISGGGVHVCGLREDGRAGCWGANGGSIDFGQASPPPNETFLSIASGAWHTCGVGIDGAIVCWGRDEDEQASPPSEGPFKSVSGGWAHTCAILGDGITVCWGADGYGQASPPEDEVFVAIGCGGNHTCGIRADGIPVCWGRDNFRQSSPRGQ